jgi:hypothetical protein
MKAGIIAALTAASLATGAVGSAPVAAQTSQPAEDLPPSGSIPETLLGAPCKAEVMGTGQTRLMRICFGKPVAEKPSVSFMILTSDQPVSREAQIRANRDALNDRQIIDAKEADFSPSTLPGSVGVLAFYKTDRGDRIIWSVYHEGKWYKVVVFAFSSFDAKAAQVEVEAKYFGIGKP